MIDKKFLYNFTSYYFLFVFCSAILFILFSTDYNPFFVWVVISLLFYPLFLASFFFKHLTLQFFLIGLFFAHAVGSPFFFYR